MFEENKDNKKVTGWTKQTDNKFLNMYIANAVDRNGREHPYYFATRREEGDLMCQTGELKPDGTVIYAVLKDDPGKIVLVRQYRYPVNQYIYELPAGLVDAGETPIITAVREMKEETGFDFEPYTDYDEALMRPFVQNQGMSDECDSTVFGYACGDISLKGNEAGEYIEVVVADKDMVRRILREEVVTIRAAYLLMNFLKSDEKNPFEFLNI